MNTRSGTWLLMLPGLLWLGLLMVVPCLLIFVLIFSFFAVPPAYQHRVLFWGVVGALVMRGAFIFAGAALLERFDWILYLFGAFLLFTAFKMLRHNELSLDPQRNPVLRFVGRFVSLSPDYDGRKVFTRRGITMHLEKQCTD